MKDYLSAVEQDDLIKTLGQLMSFISEECYCAGWLIDSEYLIPEVCKRALENNKTQNWGHGEINPGLAAILFQIAEKIGSWVNLNENGNGFSKFNPWPIPMKFIKQIDNENGPKRFKNIEKQIQNSIKKRPNVKKEII